MRSLDRRRLLMRKLDRHYAVWSSKSVPLTRRVLARRRVLIVRDALRAHGTSYRTLRRHIGALAFKADPTAGGETLDQVKGLLDDAGVTTGRMEALFKVLSFFAQDFLQGVTEASASADQIIAMLAQEGVDQERLKTAWGITTGESSTATPVPDTTTETVPATEAAPEASTTQEQPKRRIGVQFQNSRRLHSKHLMRHRKWAAD